MSQNESGAAMTEPLKFDPESVERVTIPPRKGVHGQMVMPEDCYRQGIINPRP